MCNTSLKSREKCVCVCVFVLINRWKYERTSKLHLCSVTAEIYLSSF